jgi:hypothetical protein
MGLKDKIPGTQARRDRLFQTILAKEVGDHDGLALVEWEDGSVTLKPVIWESDLSAIIDPETRDMWFARGRGGQPKNFSGLDLWYVYAGNAGIISTEASLIADQERHDDVIDVGAGDEVPDEVFELGIHDPNNDRIHGEQDEVDGSVSMEDTDPLTPSAGDPSRARADGGGVIDISDEAAVYDLRPPEGYDGVAIDIRDPDDFDPWPVTREDAKAAAEHFERSVDDGTDTWMKGFLVGLLVALGIWLLMTIVPWLLGQIGGGSVDTGSAGDALTGFLTLVAVPARSRVHTVLETVTSKLCAGLAGLSLS